MPKGPWIAVVPPEEATGDLKRAYDRIRMTRGRIPEIRSVMGGEPRAMEVMAGFFPENNYNCTSIDRRLAELSPRGGGLRTGRGRAPRTRTAREAQGDKRFRPVVRDYRSAGLPERKSGRC